MLSHPASPLVQTYTHAAQFSPTPLPVAMTPDHSNINTQYTHATQSYTNNNNDQNNAVSPSPLPQALSPAMPAAAHPIQSRKPAQAPGSPLMERAKERVLQPGAYEGQYIGSDEDVIVAWIHDLIGENCAAHPSLQVGACLVAENRMHACMYVYVCMYVCMYAGESVCACLVAENRMHACMYVSMQVNPSLQVC
jgi:hypothetical protein